jgi:hypothetical protein
MVTKHVPTAIHGAQEVPVKALRCTDVLSDEECNKHFNHSIQPASDRHSICQTGGRTGGQLVHTTFAVETRSDQLVCHQLSNLATNGDVPQFDRRMDDRPDCGPSRIQ